MHTLQHNHPLRSIMFILLMALAACVLYMLMIVVQSASQQLPPVQPPVLVRKVQTTPTPVTTKPMTPAPIRVSKPGLEVYKPGAPTKHIP